MIWVPIIRKWLDGNMPKERRPKSALVRCPEVATPGNHQMHTSMLIFSMQKDGAEYGVFECVCGRRSECTPYEGVMSSQMVYLEKITK